MGRKQPILVKRLLAKIHSADCSIYRWTDGQMDGYKDGDEKRLGTNRISKKWKWSEKEIEIQLSDYDNTLT